MSEIKDKVVSLEILKVAYDELKEETGQLSEEKDTQIGELKGDIAEKIYRLDNGDIIYFKVTNDMLENGGITYSNGELNNDNLDLMRTKDYIFVNVGSELSVYCKNGNGVNLIFYNEDNTYGESRAISPTSTTASRTITINYPKMKIVYLYHSSDYPISADNVKFYTKSNLENTIESIQAFLYETTSVDSYNFNELRNGYYYVSRDSSQSDISNAPHDMTYGNFFVIAHPIGNNATIQFAYTSTNELSIKRGFVRVFDDNDTNIIKWSDLGILWHKSQDKYVAFGDSITHGYKQTTNNTDEITSYQYWKTIANTLKLLGSEGANTGSGYVYVQGNKNALRIIDEYNFSEVNLVTLAFGTNDWNGNIPLGTIDDSAENENINTNGTYTNNTNTIYSALKYCVEKILNQNPKITLVLITPINRTQVGNSGATLSFESNWAYGAKNTKGYTLGDVCEAIVNVAKYYSIPYIDNREGNPINRITVKNLTVDGLHPTDWGYMKLGQFYAGKIGSLYQPYQI